MTVLLYQRQSKWFYLPLILSFGFIFSYTGIHQCYGLLKKLQSGLDAKEKALYAAVSKERKNIYIQASFQALLIVAAYLIFHFLFGYEASPYYLISNVALLFLGGTYLFYTLYPKSKSMILDANLSNSETKRWYHVYLCMENAFWKGFVMGIFISSLILLILDGLEPKGQVLMIPMKKSKNKSKRNKRNKR